MDDWRIAAELASRFGTDFGLETVDDVQDEIARVAPALRGGRRRRCCTGRATARCSRSPTTPTRSCSRPAWPTSRRRGADPGEPIPPRPRPTTGADEAERRRATSGDAGRLAVADAVPTRPTLYVWDRRTRRRRHVARRTRTVSASWPPARSTTPVGSSSSSPSLASLATRTALVVHPNDLARVGVADEGDDVRVTSARGTRHGAGPDRRRHRAGHRVHGVRAGRRRRAERPRRRDRRRHRATGRDHPMKPACARARDPIRCLGRRRPHRRADRDRQDDRGVRAAAALGPAVHLVPAQGHRRHAEPHRTGPRRAVRAAARRLADGIKLFFKEQSDPNTADRQIFLLAPYLSVLPAFLAFASCPSAGRHHRRAPDVRPARRPSGRRSCG